MVRKSNLKSALRKIKWAWENEFCEYLTPAEIIALIEAGIKPSEGSKWALEWIRKKRENGICNPIWFYMEYHDLFKKSTSPSG
jgi:hypothetical protein